MARDPGKSRAKCSSHGARFQRPQPGFRRPPSARCRARTP